MAVRAARRCRTPGLRQRTVSLRCGRRILRPRSRCYEDAVRIARGSGDIAPTINALIGLSEAYLASGDAAAGVGRIGAGHGMHRAHDLADIQGIEIPRSGGDTVEALRANGKVAEARRALALAYRFLVEPIRKLTDEGLRRNYLNKIEVHRKIVVAWLAEHAPRRQSLRATSRAPDGRSQPARAFRAARGHRPAPERAAQRATSCTSS